MEGKIWLSPTPTPAPTHGTTNNNNNLNRSQNDNPTQETAAHENTSTKKETTSTMTTCDTRMGSFFLQHLNLVEHSSPSSSASTTHKAVTTQFYLDAIRYVTSPRIQTPNTTATGSSTLTATAEDDDNDDDDATRSILHTSTLSYLTWDATYHTHELTHLLLLNNRRGSPCPSPLAKSLQRLLTVGISSILDDAIVGPKDASQRAIVRNETMRRLATLVYRCGVDWMRVVVGAADAKDDGTEEERTVQGNSSNRKKKSLPPPPSPSPLGEAAIFCTIARLVAGELRISLGSVMDDEHDAAGSKGDTTVEYCIGTMVSFLHVILQLVDDDSEDDSSGEGGGSDTVVPSVPRCIISFNTDAILHTRHTFEDALDAVVQFLSSSSSSLSDEPSCGVTQRSVWDDCSHRCCRFLGAYLSEIDIWERQDDIIEDDNDNKGTIDMVGMEHRARKGLSSVQLLIAVRRGLAVCDDSSWMAKYTKMQYKL